MTSTKVGLLTATAGIRSRLRAESLSSAFAGNTGNLIFDDALEKLYPDAEMLSIDNTDQLASCTHILISLANAISDVPMEPGLLALRSQLKAAMRLNPKLRVVVTAIGSQYADLAASTTIHPDRLDFVRELSTSTEFLGVRGFYTAELLHEKGIENVWVIGDPALLHPKVRAREPLYKENYEGLKVVSHWTPEGAWRDKIGQLLRWAEINCEAYVAQTAGERVRPIVGSYRIEAEEDFADLIRYYMWPRASDTAESLMTWLIANGYWFPTAKRWFLEMGKYDLSIGTRYHGNAAAVIAGVPALQLTMDSRTMELASFHALPTLPFSEFDAAQSKEYYYELADMRPFHMRLSNLRRNLRSYWTANGIPLDEFQDRPRLVTDEAQFETPITRDLLTRYLCDSILHQVGITKWDELGLLSQVINSIQGGRSESIGMAMEMVPSLEHSLAAIGSDKAWNRFRSGLGSASENWKYVPDEHS